MFSIFCQHYAVDIWCFYRMLLFFNVSFKKKMFYFSKGIATLLLHKLLMDITHIFCKFVFVNYIMNESAMFILSETSTFLWKRHPKLIRSCLLLSIFIPWTSFVSQLFILSVFMETILICPFILFYFLLKCGGVCLCSTIKMSWKWIHFFLIQWSKLLNSCKMLALFVNFMCVFSIVSRNSQSFKEVCILSVHSKTKDRFIIKIQCYNYLCNERKNGWRIMSQWPIFI